MSKILCVLIEKTKDMIDVVMLKINSNLKLPFPPNSAMADAYIAIRSGIDNKIRPILIVR
jgi:hypothetical protein